MSSIKTRAANYPLVFTITEKAMENKGKEATLFQMGLEIFQFSRPKYAAEKLDFIQPSP